MVAAQNFPTRYELEVLMKEKKIPGLSMVIIENAEIALHLELGVKNSQAKDLVDSETLFEVASLSKPVFTYGVLKLIENGQLNLDKPLAEYLPYSDIKNDERVNSITARMVLTHTSGFPNWRPKNEPLKIHFQPGERFSYSGEGFLYLQKVIEHISGLSLEDFIKKNVFIPLEMNHSTFFWVTDNRKASGHNPAGSPIETRTGPPNAAFTLHTSALDYARFIIAIFKGIGLKSETINEMFRFQVKVQEGSTSSIDKCPDRFSDSISWGLGWGLQRTKIGDSFWHWGDNQGVKSFIVGFNNRNTAIIVFTNSSNGLSVISEIIQKYLDFPQPAFDWLDTAYSLDNQKR
jgi:CubicO group peptidase (beta-lactamase class C family)